MSSSDTFGIPYKYQKVIAAALPILGVAAAAALVVPRYQALQADREDLARIQASIRAKDEAIQAMLGRPQGPITARQAASRDEPVEFLRRLNAVAGYYGVKLKSFTAAAPEQAAASLEETNSPLVAQKTDAQNAAAAKPGALPNGTVPATLEITAEGTYASMAQFFAALETYPRLISVSGVTMRSTKYPELTTQFRLTRYTGPAATPRPTTANGVGGGAGSAASPGVSPPRPSPVAAKGGGAPAPGATASARALEANRATVTQAARAEADRTNTP